MKGLTKRAMGDDDERETDRERERNKRNTRECEHGKKECLEKHAEIPKKDILSIIEKHKMQ